MANATVLSLPVAPARPDIEIGGDRQPALTAGLMEMSLHDAIEGMAGAELVFGAWGGASSGLQYMDRRLLEFGKPLKVKLGPDLLFEGRISAICGDFPDGGTPRVGVRAEDRLQDLRTRRRSRLFERKSVGQIVEAVAADHQLQTDVQFAGPTLVTVAQLNQSDLAFLDGLARAHDAELWVEGNRLRFARTRDGEPVELRHAGTLRQFEVAADLAHQRTAVVASGWDVARRSGVSHRAEEPAVQTELAGGDSGAKILNATFGARVDVVAHKAPADASEAKSLAEAAFRHAARHFVTGQGVAETHPKLRPGGRVKLAGLGPLFDGEYRVTSVEHRFDGRRGIETAFACERPGLGRP